MKKVLRTVKSTFRNETPDFCISNSRINALLKEGEEIRVNEDGNLEIYNKDIVLELEIGNVFCSIDGVEEAYAQIVSMKEGNKVVYKADETIIPIKRKECILL